MITKLTGVAAAALVCASLSSGAFAHVSGGALTDGSGKPVSSSYEKCVTVSSGINHEKCSAAAPAKKVAKPVASKVTLSGDALFATNSDELSDAGKATLNDFANKAQQVKLVRVDVIGHADSRGAAAYNQDLSERRARTVKDYLASQGVNSNIIYATGRGESEPVASNDTREGRAQNRRVDIKVLGVK